MSRDVVRYGSLCVDRMQASSMAPGRASGRRSGGDGAIGEGLHDAADHQRAGCACQPVISMRMRGFVPAVVPIAGFSVDASRVGEACCPGPLRIPACCANRPCVRMLMSRLAGRRYAKSASASCPRCHPSVRGARHPVRRARFAVPALRIRRHSTGHLRSGDTPFLWIASCLRSSSMQGFRSRRFWQVGSQAGSANRQQPLRQTCCCRCRYTASVLPNAASTSRWKSHGRLPECSAVGCKPAV